MLRRLLLSLVLLLAGTVASAAGPAESTLEKQLKQAEADAPSEVQIHILKTYGRLSNFLAKPRNTEKIDGWQQIRVTGDAAFASWDNLRKDYVWRGGKFEVIYDLLTNGKIKATTVTFDGESRKVE